MTAFLRATSLAALAAASLQAAAVADQLPTARFPPGSDLVSDDPSGEATTGVGGGSFDLNAFLGADRYYAAGITGQNTVSFNLEAGHFWNGREMLAHVVMTATKFVHSSATFGGSAVAPKYDRHATLAAMLIGGRQTAVSPQIRQQGLAPQTDLRSAAIATNWTGSAYALGFDADGTTYATAYDAAFGTAQVINSSYGYADPAGTSLFTAFTDAKAFAFPGTLHVVSAGNSGPASNTVRAPGSGYNTLTVEHLHLTLSAGGRYGLRVEYPTNSFDFTPGQVWGDASNPQTYGLAGLAAAGRRRRSYRVPSDRLSEPRRSAARGAAM